MNSHTLRGCSNMDCTYSTCRIEHDKLKAAAPELAEALRRLLPQLEYMGAPEDHEDMVYARAALAKAGL